MKRCLALVLLLLVLLPFASAQAQASGDCVIDAVLLVDTGGSETPEMLSQIKSFAASFIGSLPMGNVRLGVVGFGETPHTQIGLTGDGGAVAGTINGLNVTNDAANFRAALEAGEALLADARPYVSRAIVLITDGFSAVDARRRAQLIRTGNVAIVTLGVGRGINRRELFNLATPSYYYGGSQFSVFQPDFDRLGESVAPLSLSLCSSSAVIGGRVNARTRDDRGYPITLPVSGVVVTLMTQDLQPLRSTTTDENGMYQFYVAPGIYAFRINLAGDARFAPGNDGTIPIVYARLGVSSLRADSLLEIGF